MNVGLFCEHTGLFGETAGLSCMNVGLFGEDIDAGPYVVKKSPVPFLTSLQRGQRSLLHRGQRSLLHKGQKVTINFSVDQLINKRMHSEGMGQYILKR